MKHLMQLILITQLFRYKAFLDNEFLSDLNFLPASVNTLVLQRNSGHIVSIC